jgi:hypothetical protein
MIVKELKDIPESFDNFVKDLMWDLETARAVQKEKHKKDKFTEAMRQVRALHVHIKKECKKITEL